MPAYTGVDREVRTAHTAIIEPHKQCAEVLTRAASAVAMGHGQPLCHGEMGGGGMSVSMVQPIGAEAEQRVRAATAHYIHRAGEIFARRFELLPVYFDLTGRAAGMYRTGGRGRVIRYNPYLFAKYFESNLAVTVPHEVAHYVVDRLFGLRRVRPHGAEWRAVMHAFGADARPSCDYDLSGIPVRAERRHRYVCGCTEHHLTTRRHNKVASGVMRYLCRRCGVGLMPAVSARRRRSRG